VASITSVIEGGIAYLRHEQQPDGSFTGDSSKTIQPFMRVHTYRTTFLPAVVLGALHAIDAAQDIRGPLATWLSAQRSPAGSFNYWAARAPERRTMPYPDDLDDTFCALVALQRHNLVDGTSLGMAVKLLVATEAQVGGPYRTWLVGQRAPALWQDVDLAVNCNIACFLRTVADPLPNLTALMDHAINTRTFVSPYYPSELPVLYYMARAYTGSQKHELSTYIHSRRPATALDMALQLSALIELGWDGDVQPIAERLTALQRRDGSWPAAAFCLDAKRGDTKYYHGSAALTTALVLEALQAYHAHTAAPRAGQSNAEHTAAYGRIITQAKVALDIADPELQAAGAAMVDHMAAGDVSQEIAMMPQLFETSLVKPSGVSDAQLEQLSVGNLFGWLAYTILDDFLDEEGKPTLLPVATAALRRAVDTFMAAAPDDNFKQYVRRTFDTIDAANAWETAHCRFAVTPDTITIGTLPIYNDLRRIAERSYGHMLTPLTILAAQYPLEAPEITHIQTALHHYLVARQLQDDLYDWEHDFRAGRITAVVAELLRASRFNPGEQVFSAVMPRLQRHFWQTTLPGYMHAYRPPPKTRSSRGQSQQSIAGR
jgi:hypothetical protein